jgi:hypothetical protein
LNLRPFRCEENDELSKIKFLAAPFAPFHGFFTDSPIWLGAAAIWPPDVFTGTGRVDLCSGQFGVRKQ